jgi:hypothetical protein
MRPLTIGNRLQLCLKSARLAPATYSVTEVMAVQIFRSKLTAEVLVEVRRAGIFRKFDEWQNLKANATVAVPADQTKAYNFQNMITDAERIYNDIQDDKGKDNSIANMVNTASLRSLNGSGPSQGAQAGNDENVDQAKYEQLYFSNLPTQTTTLPSFSFNTMVTSDSVPEGNTDGYFTDDEAETLFYAHVCLAAESADVYFNNSNFNKPNRNFKAKMICFGCKKPGHFIADCPDNKDNSPARKLQTPRGRHFTNRYRQNQRNYKPLEYKKLWQNKKFTLGNDRGRPRRQYYVGRPRNFNFNHNASDEQPSWEYVNEVFDPQQVANIQDGEVFLVREGDIMHPLGFAVM